MIQEIMVARSGAVATVTISRPAKKNAITGEMYAALTTALRELDEDTGVRAVVLTGTDGIFTSGNDLADFLQMADRDPMLSPFPFMEALVAFTKPLLGAVEGLAIGIGSTMLLHFDAVYAAPGTRFQFPFTGLGLVPEAGSSLLLPRRVGAAAASELMLFGEPFDAARAHELGMINGVFPSDGIQEHVAARAKVLAERPASAVRLSKQLLRGDVNELRARIAEEADIFRERLGSPELAEAVAAFREKRSPDFMQFA